MSPRKFRLEFIIKAKNWDEVTNVFKDELNVDSGKQDASDREIDGVFIVQVWMNANTIDSDFYTKVNDSRKIALSYDPSAKKVRDDILDRVCAVEHDLRKLLLNISDVVEDYFKIYDGTTVAKVYKNKRDIVRKGDANPITSHLTLEDEISIFSTELSPLKDKPLTANNLLVVLDKSTTLDEAKNYLRKASTSHTIWDDVNKYILKSDTSWSDILPKLDELKNIRNKAAHFRIVTQSDLERAKNLSREISNIVTPERTSTKQDLSELQRSINRQAKILSELTIPAMESALKSIRIASPGILAFQKAVQPSITAQKAIMEAFSPLIKAQEVLSQAIMPSTSLQNIYKNFGVVDPDEKEVEK